jgi:hypothetical protein
MKLNILFSSLLSVVSTAAILIAFSASANANRVCNAEISNPHREVSFSRGQIVGKSCLGHRLEFQHDGNLVLYNPKNQPVWATGTDLTKATSFVVQRDGNMVLYDRIKPLWASNTSGNPGAYLSVQGDGNLVVYNKSNRPIFATNSSNRFSGVFNASCKWRGDCAKYEVWLVAKKPGGSNNPVGHSWIALVRQREGEGWSVDTTYGFWPESDAKAMFSHLRDVSTNREKGDTEKLIRHESISTNGHAVRKARISPERARWIRDGIYREAGCSSYQAVGGTGATCNCADYATRLWHFLGKKSLSEDFRIQHITHKLTLSALADNIWSKNQRSGDFMDNGQIWEIHENDKGMILPR